MKVDKGLFEVAGWEVTDNLLATARATGRALIRVNLRFGGKLSEEETQLLATIPEAERAQIVADLQRLKGSNYSQIVRLDDLGVNYTPAPVDEASRAMWTYYTPATAQTLATRTRYICTAYTASISELLAGTPLANGVGEGGEVVPITGVTDTETGKVYATHSRVYFGLFDDEATALQTLRNGLLRDIAEGDSRLGANDNESKAYARSLEKRQQQQ